MFRVRGGTHNIDMIKYGVYLAYYVILSSPVGKGHEGCHVSIYATGSASDLE